jgi:hypothetical protein
VSNPSKRKAAPPLAKKTRPSTDETKVSDSAAERNSSGIYIPGRQKGRTRDRGWIRLSDLPRSPKADAVRADIMDRLRQHAREDTLPRGGRGLFYDLRPHGMPGNSRGVTYTKHPKTKGPNSMEANPEYVTDLLSQMRRVWDPDTGEWLVPEDWISDSRMPDPLRPSEVLDANMAASVVANYIAKLWLTRQAGQRVYLELRCESQDLMTRIERVAKPYGVWVYSGSGMDGLKAKKEAAERAAERQVPTLIGHIADLDRSGGDIRDAFAEDALAFTDWHRDHNGAGGPLAIVRIALTLEQAREHKLLDGDEKAEVDGLPVPVLDAIVREFIESKLDPAIARAVVRSEPKMRADAARLALRKIKEQSSSGNGKEPDYGQDWSWANPTLVD